MLNENRVVTGPSLVARSRAATSTHCRTLPSGPSCGSALQTPCGKCTTLPATGFSAGAAEAREEVATSDASTMPRRRDQGQALTNMTCARGMNSGEIDGVQGIDLKCWTPVAGPRFNGNVAGMA